MKKNIGVIDYGLGNILSICGALEYLGYNVIFSNDRSSLNKCETIILPGVGAFPKGINNLKKIGMDNYLRDELSERKLIGICLGMQLLFSKSYEFGEHDGLGLIEGDVKSFKNLIDERVPNIGWRKLINHNYKIEKNTKFYFVHSFYVCPNNPNYISASSKFHNKTFTAAIKKDNMYGFQFHPEKSGEIGLEFLKSTIDN